MKRRAHRSGTFLSRKSQQGERHGSAAHDFARRDGRRSGSSRRRTRARRSRWSAIPTSSFLLLATRRASSRIWRQHPALAARSRIVHTDIAIEMQDKPSQAVRRGRGSSMWLALEAVQKDEADFAVSAGNTGALMAMAKLILKTMPGIERPAIAGQWPTRGPQQHRARPRRQHRRHRAPARRLRADGRRHGARPLPHRAPARRPPQHRRRGDQGHRGGAGRRTPGSRRTTTCRSTTAASSKATRSARASSTSSWWRAMPATSR